MADASTAAADTADDANSQIQPEEEETVALYRHARSAVPAVAIIDRINKQSNIGGIVRSASALGVNHICFIGAVRVASRRSHVDQHSNKPARVPYQHMTAAQLNLCFHNKAIRSASCTRSSVPNSAHQRLNLAVCSASLLTRAVSVHFHLSASLAFLTLPRVAPLFVRSATQ